MIIEIKSGLATVIYTGDGATTHYPYSFPVPSFTDITVLVKENDVDVTSDFTFTVNKITSQVIFSGTLPTSDNEVVISRVTELESRVVDYSNTSTLRQEDLNKDSLQAFYALQELNDVEDSLRSISFNLTEKIAQINAALETIEGIIGDVDQNTEDIDNLEIIVANIQIEIAEIESSITDIQTDITEIGFEIFNIKENITILQGVDGDLQIQINSTVTNIDTLMGQVAGLLSDVNSLESNVATIQGQITSIGIEQGTQNTRLDGIDTLNTTQNSRLTAVEGVNTTQTTRLDGIDTLNTTQNSRLTSIEGINTTQTTNIATNTTNIGTNTTDIAALKVVDTSYGLRLTALEALLNYDDLNKYLLTKDAQGLFTEVQWKLGANLRKKSVLSGGTTPLYTTRTVTYYASNGVTVTGTFVYTLSYDGSNDLTSEVI